MISKPPKRTRFIDWLVCGALGGIALLILAVGVFGKCCGTTAEEDLIRKTGVARDIEASTVKGRYGSTTRFLWFTVEGYRVSFSTEQDGYERVLEAIRAGQEMTVGISTQRETLLPRKGWVPLYALDLGNDPVLTYETTVTEGYRGSNAVFIFGGVLLVIALGSLYRCHVNRSLPVG